MTVNAVLLSILVPTISGRVGGSFLTLIDKLEKQSVGRAVEILGLYDNLVRTVGEKRNVLLQAANGQFLTFVDDDDDIAETYISDICRVIHSNFDADVICFQSFVTINGGPKKLCKYSVQYKYEETEDLWKGLPAHTMVWRSTLAKQFNFPESNYGEDVGWVKQAVKLVKKEVQIEKQLYFYHFNSRTSRTRG